MDPPQIEVDQLAALPEPTSVIDVREPDEYEAGHVPGAVLIPLAEIADRVGEVPGNEPVYVICQSGGRSLRATEFLAAEGLDVTNVAGGTKAWVESGREVVTGPRPGRED
ncbi:MAG: rhodanese-like domain-containing protein [Acidimicrobiales bacterium]